jgi:hypothetical protein
VISPKVDLPETERMSLTNQVKLENILDELIENTDKENTSAKDPVVENQNVTSKVTDNPSKDTLNAEGPIEPRELSDLVTAYDTHKLDPALNKPHKEPFDEPLIKGESRDNRIVNGYDKIPGASKLPENRKRAGARIYRVQRFSDVYSNPSLRSKVLASLEPNQHVEVIEDLGSWYKILSEKGREGYVFSNCCEIR